MEFFSDHLLDQWVIESYFRGRREGFFIDMGAHNGLTNSNTAILEKSFGWTGICIEPNPPQFSLLIKNRSAKCMLACIDSERRFTEFLQKGPCSGIIAEDTPQHPVHRGEEISAARAAGKVFYTPTVSLTEVLDHLGAPKWIDYLSLDVEGAEQRVFGGLSLSRYQFELISVETPNLTVHRLLTSNGYRLINCIHADNFYANSASPSFEPYSGSQFELENGAIWEWNDEGKKRKIRLRDCA